MAVTDEPRERARQFVWEIVRAGFTQLRKTGDGHLYGSGSHRFLLPYAVAQGAASADMIAELRQRFARVVDERNADMGTPKPILEAIQPVANPEDLIWDLREAQRTETERSGPAEPTSAAEGSTPSGLPTTNAPEGVTPSARSSSPTSRKEDAKTAPMPKASKQASKQAKNFVCEKCGREFALPQGLGRHVTSGVCEGTKAQRATKAPPATPVAPKQTRLITEGARRLRPPTVGLGTLNGYLERVGRFETAAKDVTLLVKDLVTQIQVYKRERDELATKWQQVSALFERPQVPR
jgi:hypothetical protein